MVAVVKTPEIKTPEVPRPPLVFAPPAPVLVARLPEIKLPEIAPRPAIVPPTIAPPTEAVLPKPVVEPAPVAVTPPPPTLELQPAPARSIPTPVKIEPPILVAKIEPAVVPATPLVAAPEIKLTPLIVTAPAIPQPAPIPEVKPLQTIPEARPPQPEAPLTLAKLEPRPLPTPPSIDRTATPPSTPLKSPEIKLPEFTPTPIAFPTPPKPAPTPEPIIETVIIKPSPDIARAQPPTTPAPLTPPPALPGPPTLTPPTAPPAVVIETPRPSATVTAETRPLLIKPAPQGSGKIPAPLENSLLKLALAKNEEVKNNPAPQPEPTKVSDVPSANVAPAKAPDELPADGGKSRAWYQRLFAKNSRAASHAAATEAATAEAAAAEVAAAKPTPAVKSDGSAPETPARKVVTREGLVSSWVSGQAPSGFALEDPRTGKIIGYLVSTNSSLSVKMLSGRRVIVTGAETIDSRWPTAPLLTIETLKTID